MALPTRDDAWRLLTSWIESENLRKHGLAVEAVMRHYARKLGYDEHQWGLIGLVHDLDWEKFPAEHCDRTAEALSAQGWPADWIRAIRSHGWGICTDVEPVHPMENVLYTVDELTGLITATALVRPSRSILDMTVKSVKKKWKDRSFAAGANREIIAAGAERMGQPLDEVIADTIAGMQSAASELGLDGGGRSDG